MHEAADEPTGRNPEARQAETRDALKARPLDQATGFADFIKASGLGPRQKAGHMTAPFSCDEIN
ncbi:MAG: hypothetical protein ACYCZU_04445 [Devosia sp.]